MTSLENALTKIKSFENGLRDSFEKQLLLLRSLDSNIQADIDEKGFAVYSLAESDFVLATLHDGHYVPENVSLRQSSDKRILNEDYLSGELFLPLFLENGGFWITSHLSRFFVDLNRQKERAILEYLDFEGDNNLAEKTNEIQIINQGIDFYNSFFHQASKVLSDKIVLSAHTMNDSFHNGDICLMYQNAEKGIGLKESLENQGFDDVRINIPFYDPHKVFENYSTKEYFGFEVNKNLVLDDDLFPLNNFPKVSEMILNAVKENYFSQ